MQTNLTNKLEKYRKNTKSRLRNCSFRRGITYVFSRTLYSLVALPYCNLLMVYGWRGNFAQNYNASSHAKVVAVSSRVRICECEWMCSGTC